VKTLIKWPGGKTRELETIRAAMPEDFSVYIEPFLGGGAVFFDVDVDRYLINDVNADLIDFYRFVQCQSVDFFTELGKILKDWTMLESFVHVLTEPFQEFVVKARHTEDVKSIGKQLSQVTETQIEGVGTAPKFIDRALLSQHIGASIASKLERIRKLEIKHDVQFNAEKNLEHLETAIRSAYYTAIRDAFEPNNREQEVAAFFFIREYCYGSMFRFNRNGKFNIPYGGIAYNKKDFGKKIDRLRASATIKRLDKAKIYQGDFEVFFQKIWDELDGGFAFFDPPYDSEFSDYDQHVFASDDQERLARVFHELPCKAMMVIKETPLIRSLYADTVDSPIHITMFDKLYTYNVRGRNQREVKHLLITNYDPQIIKTPEQLNLI